MKMDEIDEVDKYVCVVCERERERERESQANLEFRH